MAEVIIICNTCGGYGVTLVSGKTKPWATLPCDSCQSKGWRVAQTFEDFVPSEAALKIIREAEELGR